MQFLKIFLYPGVCTLKYSCTLKYLLLDSFDDKVLIYNMIQIACSSLFSVLEEAASMLIPLAAAAAAPSSVVLRAT